MPNTKLKAEWATRLQLLVGRTIKLVRYMTTEEQEACGFRSAPVVLQLDDNTLLYPSRDDEGNNAGALFIEAGSQTQGIEPIAPVI